MTSKLHILAAVAAIGLAGYALVMLLEDAEAIDEAQEVYLGPDGEPLDARTAQQRRKERLAAAAHGLDPRQRGYGQLPSDADEVVPPPLIDGPAAAVTAHSARAGFDYAMRRVEKLADRKRRLSVEQWQVLYREANDAYAALSMVLDAEIPSERAELEDGHKRLKEGLARVRVLGKKFQP